MYMSFIATNAQIDTMEAKVVKPLLEYDGLCRKARVRIIY